MLLNYLNQPFFIWSSVTHHVPNGSNAWGLSPVGPRLGALRCDGGGYFREQAAQIAGLEHTHKCLDLTGAVWVNHPLDQIALVALLPVAGAIARHVLTDEQAVAPAVCTGGAVEKEASN